MAITPFTGTYLKMLHSAPYFACSIMIFNISHSQFYMNGEYSVSSHSFVKVSNEVCLDAHVNMNCVSYLLFILEKPPVLNL